MSLIMYFIFINSPNEFNKNDGFIALAAIMCTVTNREIEEKERERERATEKNHRPQNQ